MIPATETFDKLTYYDLCVRAGAERPILTQEEQKAHQKFTREVPVTVKVVAEKGICEDKSYDICKKLEGSYKNFIEVKSAFIGESLKILPAITEFGLTVILDGVFAGISTELHNFRNNIIRDNPTKGLGQKIAEIQYHTS